jgi:hypothetical protein
MLNSENLNITDFFLCHCSLHYCCLIHCSGVYCHIRAIPLQINKFQKSHLHSISTNSVQLTCNKCCPFRVSLRILRVFCELSLQVHLFPHNRFFSQKQLLCNFYPGWDCCNSETANYIYMLVPSNCRFVKALLQHTWCIAIGSQFDGIFYVKTYHKISVFIS